MTTKLCFVIRFAPGKWNSPGNRGGGGVLVDYDKVIEAMPNPHPCGLTRRPGHSNSQTGASNVRSARATALHDALRCVIARSWAGVFEQQPSFAGCTIKVDIVTPIHTRADGLCGRSPLAAPESLLWTAGRVRFASGTTPSPAHGARGRLRSIVMNTAVLNARAADATATGETHTKNKKSTRD